MEIRDAPFENFYVRHELYKGAKGKVALEGTTAELFDAHEKRARVENYLSTISTMTKNSCLMRWGWRGIQSCAVYRARASDESSRILVLLIHKIQGIEVFKF